MELFVVGEEDLLVAETEGLGFDLHVFEFALEGFPVHSLDLLQGVVLFNEPVNLLIQG